MLPTFFGLNTVTRALLAQQEAIDVLNQNVSNVNTPGYSRQDAIIAASDPYTTVAFNRPSLSGQLGQGASVTTINRFQDELLNSQIRFTNQSVGQLQVMDDTYTQIQAIYNDPSNVAINSAASNFYNSIHDLTNTPESDSARQLVQQNGSTLAHAISTRFQQLTQLQSDLNTKVITLVGDINNDIRQIATMNHAIAESTGIGDNANDLKDKRDALVDDLSKLVDVRVVRNPDGTDTVQMNGRFLVNKDLAYSLTTLTDASSSALIKPVQVFWQEDVTKFENQFPGYDPVTGRNLTTNAPAAGAAVPKALISTGQLNGTLTVRDNVIQNTLLPQLNQLSDSLTNTQVLSTSTGLKGTTVLSGNNAAPDNFVITVVTPQGTPNPPGPGQLLKTASSGANSIGAQAATLAGAGNAVKVQNIIDAINSSAVAPYVHASLNAAGQLQIDTAVIGALVKVDQANGAASRDFGFSSAVADGFNMVHVQGFGLNTPPQFAGGISGLTLNSTVTVGDPILITGPDGQQISVVVPPPVTNVFPAPTTNTIQSLLDTINAKGLSHGFQAALDGQGHVTVFSAATVYGPDGRLIGTPAQITGDNTASFNASTALTNGETLQVTGPLGSFTYTAVVNAAQTDTVQTAINAINNANIGVTASLNSVGQFQLTTQNTGAANTLTVKASVGGTLDTVVKLPTAASPATVKSTVTGLDHGYPPSSSVTLALTGTAAQQSAVEQDYYGDPTNTNFPPPTLSTNTNQFFFDGAQQSLAGQVVGTTAIGAGANSVTFTQLTSPTPLSFAVMPSTSGATLTFPVTVTVTGTDAATGVANVSEVLTFNATGVQTTTHTFSSINAVNGIQTTAVAGNNLSLQAFASLTGTQYDTGNSLVVDPTVIANPSVITASTVPGVNGNDINALAMLNVQQQAIVSNGQTAATMGDFYSNITENLGGSAQQVQTDRTSEEQLVQHFTNQKQSIVGVNVDEEAAHLIALQHAYQAAARAITAQDSMLDTIINGMGLVGRG